MLEWRNGASRLAMGVVVAALFAPMAAEAASFTINNGETAGTKAVTGNETGTIAAGGTISAATGITWTGSSPAPGVTIDNSGTILGSTRGIDATGLSAPANITVWNRAGATITGIGNDAFRINSNIGSGTINVYNYGTILSTGGQALDFDAISSTTATVNIVNFATGVIKSTANDAIRPGQGAIVTNYGLIYSEGVVGASNDGIDWQGRSGTVINKTGGIISGLRHGITTDVDVKVTNEVGATIIGRNGSGVGSDGAGTVVNYGRITGAYDGSGVGDGDGVDVDNIASVTNYGIIEGTGAAGYKDGLANASEGLSIGGGTILNYGTISGADAGIVVNNDGNLDRSGLAATTLTNYGTIVGQRGYAIRMENKLGTAADNDTITNYGTIIGNGAIPNPNATVLTDTGTLDPANGTLNGVTYAAGSARFIRGDGSAIQMGEGNDVLTNYGTIIGNNGRAVNMEGGNDTVNVMKGSRIVGLVDGGVGTDTLNYNKAGLTDAKRAALQAGQTVNIGGTLYTSFEVITGASSSFASFASAGSLGVASLFDNLPANATSSAVVNLLDSVASSADVGAALAQLTPAAYQGLGRMTMNDAFQTTSLVGQHLTQNRLGGLGTDMSGVGNALAMFDGGMFDKNFSADRALAAVTGFPGSASSALADAGWGGNAADAMAYAPVTKALPGLRPVAVAAEQGLFITSGASFAREGARTDAPGFKSNTVNVLAGYDRRITDSLVAGVFGGYALTRGDIDNVGSHTKISTGTIGGYGTYQAPGWFATAMGLYGFSDYDTTRVAVGTTNTAAFSGDHYAIRGTVGTDLRVSGWVVTPEIGLQYTRVMTDGFAERGGAAALVVGSDSSESLRSSVGARFAYDYALNGGVLTPELRLAWLHEFSDGVRGINASFADTTLPGSFITATGSALRDRGVIGAGLSGRLAPLTVLSVNYDAIVGSNDAVAHQVMGRIRHSF
ncbi:autotransporter outer membrane beta-barrel domain-containing protein [Tardiphaga sp. 42S5]|uniref:autotransporter family protein n=1 Tax=Tardiphaga sp. 42S5 TaxID=1404799 RepID=UPI002A59BB83|nr:autotransporter outer membrane beta-barrel domain-containing protein [Tardiphaga sp. 42S5]WPO43114.1 autotransporter outer membrane beta-barrel domain-containing protein [Tardiphaga sp. 42S5]